VELADDRELPWSSPHEQTRNTEGLFSTYNSKEIGGGLVAAELGNARLWRDFDRTKMDSGGASPSATGN
jgi:hypothetical protein